MPRNHGPLHLVSLGANRISTGWPIRAGRESANLYHRAKYFHFFGLPVALAMYCTLPFEVSPTLLFYPIVLATALLSRMQWKYYKKYL
ncbi:MAG: DUF4400 domain-containing protein [Pseudomonadota bacterium]|nr:DUF4400 domain-containing protein [Pseudomonadota bacterium]